MSKYLEKMTNLDFYHVREGMYHPPTRKEIIEIEREIGHTFPLDYVDFLTAFGGSAFNGYVDFPFLEPYTRDERGLISVFLGILPDDAYDLFRTYQVYRKRIPPNFLPIADDPGGNIICLSLDGEDNGSIYFWDHEDEEIPGVGEVAGYSNVYLLARSFDEFINSLQKDDDE